MLEFQIMEIYCELKRVEEGELESIKGGPYLSIKTNMSATTALIPFGDFESIYLKSRQISTAVLEEPGIGQDQSTVESKNKQKPNFKEVLNFLMEKMSLNKASFTNDELIVQSDICTFLELPWEEIIETDLFIIRKIVSAEEKSLNNDETNLLLLMSHAHEGVGTDIKAVMDKEIESIYESLHFLIENNQSYFRVDNILLSKHTTVNSIKKILWKDFKYVHFIMHGDPEGNLCLENSDPAKYRSVEKFSPDQFLDLIKDYCLEMIFLSMCYSGGGVQGKDNLAFKIIKSGSSKYVISYADPVGDISAKVFTDSFYKNLTTGKKIEEIYKDSLKAYYALNKREYIPFLYSHV